MGLNQAQRAMVEKARALGAGGQGVALTEGACSYLLGVIVADLGLEASFPELVDELPSFFGDEPVSSLKVADVAFLPMLERLCEAFEAAGGESFVGDSAWEHLNSMAGSTMARFLDLYVHTPMLAVVEDMPQSLPPMTIRMDSGELAIDVGDETFRVSRDQQASRRE